MAKAIQRIVLKDFKGIDRRAGAPPNSFWDLCNLHSVGGVLETAPNLSRLEASTASVIDSVHEYIADSRFEDSHRDALIFTGPTYVLSSTYLANPSKLASFQASPRARVRSVMHKMVHSSRYMTEYMPCLVMVDGENPPTVYHQYAGVETVASLVAASGGYTGTAYLDEPPIAKHCAVYKNRLFFANTEGAENRMYWTDADSAMVWTANVWPAAYNMDVGYGESITNLLVYKGVFYIFTNKAIWVLGGEGQQGLWSLSKLADVGASEDCVCAAGDVIFFANDDGAYLFSGGQVKKVSDPVEHAWKSGRNVNSVTFLSEHGQVVVCFSLSNDSGAGDYVFVLNINSLAWHRIGYPGRKFQNSFMLSPFRFFDSRTKTLGHRSLALCISSASKIYSFRTPSPISVLPFWAELRISSPDSFRSTVREVLLEGSATSGGFLAKPATVMSSEIGVLLAHDDGSVFGSMSRGVTSASLCMVASISGYPAVSIHVSSCAITPGKRAVLMTVDDPLPMIFCSFTVSTVTSVTAVHKVVTGSADTPSGSLDQALIWMQDETNASAILCTTGVASRIGIVRVPRARSAGLWNAGDADCFWGMDVSANDDQFYRMVGCNVTGKRFRVCIFGFGIFSGDTFESRVRSMVRIESVAVGMSVLGRAKVTG